MYPDSGDSQCWNFNFLKSCLEGYLDGAVTFDTSN